MIDRSLSFPYSMEQTMRWFGPRDPVSLSDIRQAGCTGVVTALHEMPNGAVWSVEAIAHRKALIEQAGLRWSVVESLPVHEAIKLGGPGRDDALENYKKSLVNLHACGVTTVTYNFMPLLDWTRTDLAYELPDGALALRFEPEALAAYDIHILRRPLAERSYSNHVRARAAAYFASMDGAARHGLERTIIARLPGSEESFGPAEFLAAIEGYAQIDAQTLRENLFGFLRAVCPLADDLGMRLVIHPDDPPFELFGLPRVVGSADDLGKLFDAVPNVSNGLCFCVGSFGVAAQNDLPAMIRRFGDRVHFLHLRNVRREAGGGFHEATHLGGSSDMVAIMKAIRSISMSGRRSIPMRPDHGHRMLDDLEKSGSNPGYSAIGRLRGLAELRGLEIGIAAHEGASQ